MDKWRQLLLILTVCLMMPLAIQAEEQSAADCRGKPEGTCCLMDAGACVSKCNADQLCRTAARAAPAAVDQRKGGICIGKPDGECCEQNPATGMCISKCEHQFCEPIL